MENGTDIIEILQLLRPENESEPISKNFMLHNINSTVFSWDTFLAELRSMYINDVYGENYKLNFYVSFVVCIVGYVTNTCNIVVLAATPMSHSMNMFLLVLSAADIAHITTQFSHIIHYLTGFKMFPDYSWVVFYIANTYLETTFLYVTNWLAVAIGVWRFMAITWPLQSRDWCSKGRAKKVIFTIFMLSVIIATPVFAVLTYKKFTFHHRDLYDKGFTELAKKEDGVFLKFYWSLLLLEGFVPSLLLIGLTLGLIKTLYAARQNRSIVRGNTSSITGSNRTTAMLTILLFLYVLSNLPDGCMYLVSIMTNGNLQVESNYQHATSIIRVFMLSNNSVSFFIYYGLGEAFRKVFHRIFCQCFTSKIPNRDESGKTISELTTSRTSVGSQCLRESVFVKSPVSVL